MDCPRDVPPAEDRARDVLGEMAALLHDSRPGVLVCGAAIGAIAIGTAIEALALPLISRNGPGIVVVGGLFVILVLCLLRNVLLLAMSGLPLSRVLDQQRVCTGAPLDPRAPWATIPEPGDADIEDPGLGRRPSPAQPGPLPGRAHPGHDEFGPRHDRHVPRPAPGRWLLPLNRARRRNTLGSTHNCAELRSRSWWI